MLFKAKFSSFVATLLIIVFAVFLEPAFAVKKSYIVYLGAHNHGKDVTTATLRRISDSHTELLASFVGSNEKAKDAIIYSYKRHINGFAALLEDEEAAEIAKHPDVISVFPDQSKQLHTSHSWEFLSLEKVDGMVPPYSIWNQSRFGEDIIIGNFDTGVWPESKSFSDNGNGLIPSKWKGICQFDDEKKGLCNRKLIGARYFNKAYAAYVTENNGTLDSSLYTPRDPDGHGTHTLSTAGGNYVAGANVFGFGNGTVKGGSPKARVAGYRVCYPEFVGGQCFDADMLKGFDTAISDGVDVLSVSVGIPEAVDYFIEGLAIGSFHAVQKGVVVVASGGNEGPTPATVGNVAPWLITVAASTMDRKFLSDAVLITGQTFEGYSISTSLPTKDYYPLISAAQAVAANASVNDAIICKPGSLDPTKVKGKILVCLRGDFGRTLKSQAAALAGAVGMILCNDQSTGNELEADPHVIPATHINYTDGLILYQYINTTSNPQGLITPPTAKFGTKPAPSVASFSSRGPNLITPEILKPDIAAPGVDIIAAYSESATPTEPGDTRRTPWNTISGTSMACPHVAGVAGLLKTLHPDWSPAAIRSAIMTSATTTDNTMNPITDADKSKATPFAFGAGQIQPNQAMNPGLVYDLAPNDYIDFLCGQGYNQTLLSKFTGSPYKCPDKFDIFAFNYPSFSAPKVNISEPVTFTRTLKNVGGPGTYLAFVSQAPSFSISVEPRVLKFEKAGEEKSFEMTVKAIRATKDFEFGQLIWSDGKNNVRSPIAVSTAGVPN